VLPLVVLACGAVAVAVVSRRLAAEAAALRPGVDDLARLGADARAAVAEGEALARRSGEIADVRGRVRSGRRRRSDPGPLDDGR
jgi:hypothetical protein